MATPRPYTTQNFIVQKPQAGTAIGGVISGQARAAMEVGAQVLQNGGNGRGTAVLAVSGICRTATLQPARRRSSISDRWHRPGSIRPISR